MLTNQSVTPVSIASRTLTTMRTGLTENQLRDMSTTIQQSGTPIHSEIVNKRRRIDSAIDRNSDFLSRQGVDDSANGNSFMNMMIMQANQRDIRNEEWRREDVAREIRRQADMDRRQADMDRKEEAENKKEEARVRLQNEREEQRHEREKNEKVVRDDMRRKDDLDREERREKADKERSEMMLLFLSKK